MLIPSERLAGTNDLATVFGLISTAMQRHLFFRAPFVLPLCPHMGLGIVDRHGRRGRYGTVTVLTSFVNAIRLD
jgi:hypothetical protein